MSEFEVRRARMDVEKSAAEFEVALDQLGVQIEKGMEKAHGFTAQFEKMRDPSEMIEKAIDKTIQHTKESATKLFSDLRTDLEGEIEKMEKRPFAIVGGVLATGLVLGYWVGCGSAARTREQRSSD